MNYTALFSPISIGNVTIPNRFVMAPMGNNFSDTDGNLSERSAAYYGARAKGGFGLITVEATVVDPTAKGGFRKSCLYDDAMIPGLCRMARVCHEHGAKVSVQLQHAGPEGNPAVTGHSLAAASSVASRQGGAVPQAVTKEEIGRIVSLYGAAASRARTAGADLVELHCAHGYFLHSFLSPRTNHRVDEFGGCTENRLRIVSLILEEIRRQAGADFPVCCRISGSDELFGGITTEESIVQAMLLEEMGIRGLSVSRSVHLRDEKMWAPTGVPGGFSEEIFSRIRQAVSIPVTAVGRFTMPYTAERVLRQEKADLIAFGRQSIADPELPKKVRENNVSRITPCVGCLQGCVPNMFAGEPIACMVNPAVGREGEIQPAQEQKRVLVLGGGPAGLTAARICALRGHDVTLWEEKGQLGGQLRLAAVPPGKGEYTAFLTTLAGQTADAGVKIELNKKEDGSAVSQNTFDTIIDATGSKPILPAVEGIDSCDRCFAEDVLDGGTVCGRDVLILGGGLAGLETAAFLAERNHTVTVIERTKTLADTLGKEHRLQLMELLGQYHVTLLTDTEIIRLTKDTAYVRTGDPEQRQLFFDTLVVAAGRRKKENKISCGTAERHTIGDAAKPGNALEAIKEAYELGLCV